jgi:two-component system OmpR family sensor kinase
LGVGEVAVIKSSSNLYLKIDYLDEVYYLFDKNQDIFKQEEFITALFFIFDILLMFFIYLSILKILSPLKRLSNSMEQFAKGNFDIKVQNSSKDEIGLLSKSFNKMADDLKKSFNDRENLLRYFGHEIRTPLTKAKYALESKNLDEIEKNLKQIEKFVEDVLSMHLINSKNFKNREFKATTLVVEALNITKVERDDDIEVRAVDDFGIVGDLHYLSIALKNLIENGLKYSTALPIQIEIKNKKILVFSSGEELKEGLEYYIQPFNKNSTDGFGLGLSLSDLILKEHNFKLDYLFKEGRNIFFVEFNPPKEEDKSYL